MVYDYQKFIDITHKVKLKISTNNYVKEYIKLILLLPYIFDHMLYSLKYKEKMANFILPQGNFVANITSCMNFLLSLLMKI